MVEIKAKNDTYLSHIKSPDDIKALPPEAMPALAEEIREALVETVTKNGGHLASNLGVVELTMAIHRVFDSPRDHIIFDVGHQSYVHKMLTGRYEKMDTIRQSGGLCGFTNRAESEHDCFGAGHSSTSLSAALGFAISDKLSGSDAYTVAVIGDGAYTGGMIHEALNNCRKDIRLIIIMNENEMSISKNIGRFARNLARIRNKSAYFKTKKVTGAIFKHIPFVGKYIFRFIRALKKAIKNAFYGSNYFENMGLTYLGPIDGNDYEAVEKLLREAVKLDESVVVHIKTQKGKGYEPAEAAPDKYHGMSPEKAKKEEKANFSHVMGEALCDMAAKDERICAVTASMCDGTGLESFRDRLPSRFFDVGIAEEHAVTFAAGLAANGMKPYFAVYSSFLQRAYDNVIHDVALQKLPVVFCIDRAGLNASDGATHHGIFDVAFLSQIPNMRIFTPFTNDTLRLALKEAQELDTPSAIRYPNACESERVLAEFYRGGTPEVLSATRNYSDSEEPCAVIVVHGRMVLEALEAADELARRGMRTGIILLEVLKPYAETAQTILGMLPESVNTLLFVEEEIKNGGMGMILCDILSHEPSMQNKKLRFLGVDDSFVTERRTGERICESAHLSYADVVRAVLETK